MGILGKKKKKETAEELRARLKELEGGPGEELPEPPKEETKVGESTLEVKGEFSLSTDEMALAVNALAASEEFKVYQQMVVGQQMADIIAAYYKVVGRKENEVLPEDTEEALPEPQ